MSNQLPILAVVGLVVLFVFLRRRQARKKRSPLTRIREGIEGALDDAETRTAELRDRANKLRGEAKRRMQEQAHELEARQKELRGRLDELKTEATRLLERARH